MIQVYDFMATGKTYKQLGVGEMVDDALANNVNTMCVISSGNLSYSLLNEIKERGLEEKIFFVNLVNQKVRKRYDVQIPQGRILRDARERELWVQDESELIGKIKDYTDFIPKVLEKSASDILQEEPDFVSVGLGGGKLFLTLFKEIKKNGLQTRLVGIVPKGENGIFNDRWLIERNGKLLFNKSIYNSVADKLATPYTSYKKEILEAIAHGHYVIEAENKDFLKAHKKASELSYESEISGSAGFTVMDQKFVTRHNLPITKESNVVIVNTGKGKLSIIKRRRPFMKTLTTLSAVLAVGGGVIIDKAIEQSNSRALLQEHVQKMINMYPLSNQGVVNFITGKREVNELNNDELERVSHLIVTDDPKDKLYAQSSPDWQGWYNRKLVIHRHPL